MRRAGSCRSNGFFGLHPSLGFLGQCYSARELIVLHAVASPYRERSHFDGQDVLENGALRAHALQTGWLNRALAQLPGQVAREAGVALGQNVPLIMRGPAEVTSWSPSKMSALDEETLARITDLYAKDPLLSVRLADALAADAMVSAEEPAAMSAGEPRAPQAGTAAAATPAGVPAQPYGARYAQIVTPPPAFCARSKARAWPCSTPPAGIRTPTRAVPRDNSPGVLRRSIRASRHSSRNSGRRGPIPRCCS